MIKHSQTHTPKDMQKHNQNNNRQKKILGDDINPRYTRHELNLIFGVWILGYPVPPKNIKQCYYWNLEI